ncbi:hypothetical protein O0L34_g1372 [Tuta absoluta]|nr:hypothetical protein O0L34_g1372 [Tuta absoluta]
MGSMLPVLCEAGALHHRLARSWRGRRARRGRLLRLTCDYGVKSKLGYTTQLRMDPMRSVIAPRRRDGPAAHVAVSQWPAQAQLCSVNELQWALEHSGACKSSWLPLEFRRRFAI